MPKDYNPRLVLPEHITLEDLDEYAHQLHNRRRRERYAANPEQAYNQRIRAAINLLHREKRLVLPPLPWTDLQKRAVFQAVKAAADTGRL